jgi:hypothetical protein
MTTTRTMTRAFRLAIGTAAVLALMSQAALAGRPSAQQRGSMNGASSMLVRKGTYMPVSPANNVAAAHTIDTRRGAAQIALGRLDRPTPVTTVTVAASGDGFDWAAASTGAGLVIALVLIGAAALSTRGRRGVPRSA